MANPKAAIQDYTAVIERDPQNAEAYNNRGTAYRKTGSNSRAIEDFRKAAQLGHRAARAYLRSNGIGWER
jgi:Tfp pilus assembly protein PilF